MSFLLNYLYSIGLNANSMWSVAWFIFIKIGWIFFVWILIKYSLVAWLNWRQGLFAEGLKWITLAVDVPRDNEQSPKAVEQIFNQLWGSKSAPTFIEKWWKGKYQTNFSFEIVSINGYVQYIIRTPIFFRDLVEASIYAQYPEAQITEIEDYTQEFTPENFQKKGYKMWGAQFHLVEDEVYPIKTYPMFEHSVAKMIIDPLAALLEIFSRFNAGEQGWFQMVIKPISDDWKEKTKNEVNKLLGREIKVEKTKIDKIFDVSSKAVSQLGDVFIGPVGSIKEEKKDEPFRMMNLTPQEKEIIELLQNKASKTGFKTKIRYIYLAKKDRFSKPKGVSGLTGALRQFILLQSNGFKPALTTKTEFFRVEQRATKKQKKLLMDYKSRSQNAGVKGDGFILNTEELASVYHFPFKYTVTPSIRKAESRRGEAPLALPTEDDYGEDIIENEDVKELVVEQTESKQKSISNSEVEILGKEKKVAPPENLPM